MPPSDHSAKSVALFQWLLLGLALLLLALFAGFGLLRDYRNVTDEEEHRLKTQAEVINLNLEQQIKATNDALNGLLEDLPDWKSANGFNENATERLKALANAMPGIRTFVITDAQGVIRVANRPELVGLDVSKRAYFKQAHDHPDRDKLYISPPFKSVLNVYIMGVSKMISGPKGEFAGIVNASLDPSYFSTLMGSVNYAPDMWTSLAHSNGIMFLMTPEREGMAGKNLAQPGSLFTRHMESGKTENLFSGTVYATGENRVVALHSIQPANLQMNNYFVVAAGRDLERIYSGWRKNALRQGLAFAAIALTAIFALALYQRRGRQFEVQRHESQLALEKSLGEFNDLVTQIPVGVYKFRMTASGGMQFDYVSPRWCQLLGVTAEAVYQDAQSAFARIHPDDLDGFVQRNNQARLDNGFFEWEGRIQNENGEIRWLRIESRSTLLENGDILWNGIQYDITERKMLLDNLQQSNAELEQFAYVASHDLREPLRMVSGFVSLLDKRYCDKLDVEAKEFIAFAVDGVKRMDHMICDLLEYSRLGKTEKPFAPVDLNDAVAEAKLNLMASIDLAQGQVDVAASLPVILGDHGKLVRLFQNLIGNALKYRSPNRLSLVKLSAAKEHNSWHICVEDNGIGIAPEHLERVFGVFQRLHSHQKYEGTGIGLAICKKIVEQHHGRIWVTSVPEQGSVFHVILPEGPR